MMVSNHANVTNVSKDDIVDDDDGREMYWESNSD
jgi:hypothetical protein